MERKQIINKVEKSFNTEDKKEPFLNRAYVDETKRILNLLKSDCGDFENPTDRAIYDIVTDILKLNREGGL